MSVGPLTCVALNEATRGKDDRVASIAKEKPGCACELEPFASCSPGLIEHEETIVRIVCEPMHIRENKIELKPSFFSHAFTKGVSVQRLEHSTCQQFVECAKNLVSGKEDRAWLGYVAADAKSIRALSLNDGAQAFSVLDAGLEENPAHAEIHASRKLAEADLIEQRKRLSDLFLKSGFHGRKKLLDQRVWDEFPNELKERKVFAVWQAVVD